MLARLRQTLSNFLYRSGLRRRPDRYQIWRCQNCQAFDFFRAAPAARGWHLRHTVHLDPESGLMLNLPLKCGPIVEQHITGV